MSFLSFAALVLYLCKCEFFLCAPHDLQLRAVGYTGQSYIALYCTYVLYLNYKYIIC
jgi:hypothetical protein